MCIRDSNNELDTEGAFLLDEPMSRENGESFEVVGFVPKGEARAIHPFDNIPTLVVARDTRKIKE